MTLTRHSFRYTELLSTPINALFEEKKKRVENESKFNRSLIKIIVFKKNVPKMKG